MSSRARGSGAPAGTDERVFEHGDNGDDGPLLVDTLTRGRQQRPIRTLVAMPAYNEEAYIAKTVLGAKRHADAVLVVDDGSKDDTVPIAEALGAIVVRHEVNKGYGGALQTIFSVARKLGAEELVIIDADGQHSPGDVPKLLAELRRGNDVVLWGEACASCGAEVRETVDGFGAYGKKAIEMIRIGGNGASAGAEILSQVRDLKVAGVRSESPAAEPRYRAKRIAVVVPAYNEEDLIGEVLDGIPDYVAKVYVVDDGSADMTGAIIDDYARLDPRIVAIHHN
ncbi:MAG: glycosyltransferase, partial [Methanoculleus sp.]|nr:glycosyltransferase [Methanoculleus sp.]